MNEKIVLSIVGVIIYVVFGSYIGSYIFYDMSNLDPNTAGVISWYDYYTYYADNKVIQSNISKSLLYAYGGLAVAALLLIILTLIPKKKECMGMLLGQHSKK